MKIIRFSLSVILGLLVTFGLFVLMYELISSSIKTVDEEKYTKIADIFQQEKEIDEKVKVRKPKKPDDPAEPPPEMPRQKTNIEAISEILQMAAPSLTAKAEIGIGGSLGGDGEYIPLVKIQPVYPRRALERGISGYVDIEFVLTASGAVRDPVVIYAEDHRGRPTTIFNKAALKAVLKLKYKPRVIDGKPVEVLGVPHRFRFQMKE
jgi:protein TonB